MKIKYSAYSYVRLSTKSQAKTSSGAERQLSKPQAICDANGWTLQKQTFSDLGCSAFRGKNRLKGDLATFIDLAKNHQLAPQPLIILEAWDRFSRQDIDESENAVMDLLKSGVAIHVAFSGQTFTAESTKKIEDRISILLALKAAHEFSANLSKRIKDAKQRKLAKLRNGEIVKHNNVPRYLTYDKKTNSYLHNENTALVKRLVKEFLGGDSLYAVTKRFNEEGIKTFRRGFEWSANSVRCILNNPILIGEYLGNKQFCQRIISQEDFDTVQDMLSKHGKFGANAKGRSAEFCNIFKGVAICSECRNAMHVTTQTWDYRNKRPYPRRYRYFRCPSHSTTKNCSNKHLVDLDQIEAEFFVEFLMQSPATLLQGSNAEAKEIKREIGILEGKKVAVERKLAVLAEVDDLDVAQFKTKAKKLKEESESIKTEMDALAASLRQLEGKPIDLSELRELVTGKNSSLIKYSEASKKVQEALNNNETRKKIRLLLPSLFGQIVCFTESGGHGNGAFEVHSRQGKVIYSSLDMTTEHEAA